MYLTVLSAPCDEKYSEIFFFRKSYTHAYMVRGDVHIHVCTHIWYVFMLICVYMAYMRIQT